MDQHVEHEDDPDWQEKRIGGIKVGRTEVRQAKQFVGLLRDLFLNLMNTTDPSIAPQVSLAYMALTSADEIANSSVNLPNLSNAPAPADASVAANVNPADEIKPDLPMVVEEELESTADDQKDVNGDAENDSMNLDGSEQTEKVAVEEELPASQLRSTPSTETLATTGSQTTINEAVDIPPAPDRRPVPPPPPYASIDAKGKSTTSTNPFETTVGPQDPTKMLFGRQQDVTECMGNCMYFFEAALRPYTAEGSEKTTDLVKELFYGKARQILSYNNEQTDQLVTKVKEEEFSHLIVDAADGKNLYDGLDEYFFADKVDDFQGGNCAVREVAVHNFPPILHIQVQRVQFDRTSARVYKSNAFVQFDEVIYLDRYLDSNFEALADRRKRVTECRKQVEGYRSDIRELNENKKYPLPVADMLEITAKILEDNQENSAVGRDDFEKVMNILNEEITAVRGRIHDRKTKIENLAQEIKTQYDDLRECQYQLHAVFIHQGQANYGHYWIYIRDHVDNKWWKYNDTNVSEVSSEEIFKDTTGSTANPYFLVYVRSSDIPNYVMTVCPNLRRAQGGLMIETVSSEQWVLSKRGETLGTTPTRRMKQ
ncbi:hypothetical protein NQZ79_g7179 [Umbelopsis isabellina]|nr:hypothetical protein NQZ79_g7179 [Umbelopsis isabellina]